MSVDISKAQLDVWDAKERLYEEVKDMELRDGLHYLLQKAARVAEDLKKKRKIKTSVVRSE